MDRIGTSIWRGIQAAASVLWHDAWRLDEPTNHGGQKGEGQSPRRQCGAGSETALSLCDYFRKGRIRCHCRLQSSQHGHRRLLSGRNEGRIFFLR